VILQYRNTSDRIESIAQYAPNRLVHSPPPRTCYPRPSPPHQQAHLHRKQWYKQYLPIGNNDSRQNTFIAAQPTPAPERPSQNGASVVPPVQSGHDRTQTVNGASQVKPIGASDQPQQSLQVSPQQETPRLSSQSALNNNNAQSTTSLLRSQRTSVERVESPQVSQQDIARQDSPVLNTRPSRGMLFDRARQSVPRVRFDEPSRLQIRARAHKLAVKGRLRSSKIKDGEVIKMDKMLVRIDITQQQLPEQFDERVSQGVETCAESTARMELRLFCSYIRQE
jgi:hypothetical protein